MTRAPESAPLRPLRILALLALLGVPPPVTADAPAASTEPAASAAQAAPRDLRLEDAVAFREILEVAAAPDGRAAAIAVRVADLAGNRFDTDLFIVPLDGSGAPRQATFTPGTEAFLRWSPDGRRLGFLADRDGTPQVWALPADGGEALPLTAHGSAVQGFDWSRDGKRLLVVAAPAESAGEAARKKNGDDGYLLGGRFRNARLWVADLPPSAGAAAPLRPLGEVPGHVREDAAWSPDGRFAAAVIAPTPEADAAEEATLWILEAATGRAHGVSRSLRPSSFAWSPDGRHLAFVRPHEDNGIAREDLFLAAVDGVVAAAGGGPRPPPRNLSAPIDRDIERFLWVPDGRSIDVLYSRGTVHEIARLAAGGAPAAPRPLWAPGHGLGDPERAGDRFVFVRGGAPHELWTAAPARGGKGIPRRLTRLNDRSPALRLPPTETIRWRGPAGEIEGLLTRPPGYDPSRRYPLLVRVHGGPRLHLNDEHDPQIDVLAAQGYLVLRPNVRGSTGYGDAFTRGNVADWGAGPFADVMAGVDALIERGLAEPERLFLYGWSYGGYLVNWAVTHTDRFRAAASGAGVADLRMQYVLSDARRWRFDYFGGSPFLGHLPIYEKESPITYAAEARVPTLFVHGALDDRCPLAQGLMMHRALADRGIPTDLLIFPREGHAFEEPRHIIDRLRRILDWFRRFDPAFDASRPAGDSGAPPDPPR
ncbi:MAG: prolyl oligopeptidase family serine peptidase [Candidatus Polarisedimenticolia bacterium]